MTLDDLNLAFRMRADDIAVSNQANNLWSDDEITLYLNEAVTEACIRGRLLFDFTSPFCSIPLVTAQQAYTLDPSIIEIQAVRIDNYGSSGTMGIELIGTSQTELTREYWQWASLTGRPMYYLQDMSVVRLAPVPDNTGTMTLFVYRIPTELEQMVSGADSPVIPAQYHLRLLDWALYLAYSKMDAETLNPEKAAIAEQRFEASFGKRLDANVERKRKERRSNVTVSAWPRPERNYSYFRNWYAWFGTAKQ